jgi:hypothetical protein
VIGDVDLLLWGLGAALVVALLITFATRTAASRRRREHEALVRDAASRMCVQGSSSTLRKLHRDLVALLVRQDAELDRFVCTQDDESVLAAAFALPEAGYARRRGDVAWPVHGRAPRVEDHPDLPRLCAWMRATVTEQIRLAHAVLVHAARFGVPDEVCRRRVLGALTQAADGVRASAEAGPLAALCELTRFDLPVPDDGVPGQANVHDLRRQARALALLVIGHREATALWRVSVAAGEGEA